MTIATLSHVKETLGDLHAKKKFGQNFLIDANIVDKIARKAVEEELTVIEIGPGLGALSEMLLKYGKRLHAYEIDEDMYEILKAEFSDEERFSVELGDFLDVELEKVFYHDEPIYICSNLPYYVTTPILFKLFESRLDIRKITVMVQKEVASRFSAPVGSEDYNALSLIVQYLYDVKLEMNVSRKVFYPSPNVDSAVISFTPKVKRDYEYEQGLFSLIKNCFMKRRKTLLNNLKDHYDRETIEKIYAELGLKDTVRAQELKLEDYKRIYEVLNEK